MGSGGDPLSAYAKHYPLMAVCHPFDKELGHGDAEDTDTFPPNTLDFIHSSHLLEHVLDPYLTLTHWLTLLKPGGYIVSIVPDEDMYEQGVWPSRWNGDHKHTFTISKPSTWSPVSIELVDLLPSLHCTVERICRLTAGFDPDTPFPHRDQSTEGKEVGIEFIIRKPGGVSLRHGHPPSGPSGSVQMRVRAEADSSLATEPAKRRFVSHSATPPLGG